MVRVPEEEDVYVTETTFNRKTGLPVFRRTSLNGALESPPDDSPSLVHYDELGRPDRMEWHRAGQWHRDPGPSVVYINPDNGVHVVERFEHYGVARDLTYSPSRIVRDRDSGEISNQYNDTALKSSKLPPSQKPPSPR